MTTFDFKEVRFVRVSQAMVPDFLSRPFKDKEEPMQDGTSKTRHQGRSGTSFSGGEYSIYLTISST